MPGDVLITNDPWNGTGHLMDLTILSPIFKDGRVVAFAGSVAHSPDLGGVQRWNAGLDVHDEGLMLPPIKLYSAGRPNETLKAILQANSRLPDQAWGDIEAQLAANDVATRRLIEIMQEHELETLEPVVDEIYARSEASMREVLAELPDGDYEYQIVGEGFFDPAARVPDPELEEYCIRGAVRIRGSDVTVDYTGSSPQVRSSINCTASYTWAYTTYAMRLACVPYAPHNSGFARPVHMVAPEGSVVSVRRPAPTLLRHILGQQVIDVIFGALARIAPDRVMAAGGSTPNWIALLSGEDRHAIKRQRHLWHPWRHWGAPNA
jgi:N-methylhydantoinase B